MDTSFEMNVNTVFSERHGQIVTKLRKENSNHYNLTKRVKEVTRNLETTLTGESWATVNELINLLTAQHEAESHYLYVNGMKDLIDVFHYLDTDYINSQYEVFASDGKENGGET